MKLPALFFLAVLMFPVTAAAQNLVYRGPGLFEATEPGASLPPVHLPAPPPEMRLAMDQSPVPSRPKGIVYGPYYIHHRHMQQWAYGLPSPGTFHFIPDERWPALTDWNPARIDWSPLPPKPPELESSMEPGGTAGRGEAVIRLGRHPRPVEGNGRFHFSTDYKW